MKIDLGCGPNKKEGFIGVDQYPMEGVDIVCDLSAAKWPFENESVEEASASHFVEHLEVRDRCHFVNELYRVLKPRATATVIVPSWSSSRAYGDPTHAWPPVSEFWFYYLDKDWRAANAPHTDVKYLDWGYNCDFETTWGYALHPGLAGRNPEYNQHAITFFKEAAQDIHATLTKK